MGKTRLILLTFLAFASSAFGQANVKINNTTKALTEPTNVSLFRSANGIAGLTDANSFTAANTFGGALTIDGAGAMTADGGVGATGFIDPSSGSLQLGGPGGAILDLGTESFTGTWTNESLLVSRTTSSYTSPRLRLEISTRTASDGIVQAQHQSTGGGADTKWSALQMGVNFQASDTVGENATYLESGQSYSLLQMEHDWFYPTLSHRQNEINWTSNGFRLFNWVHRTYTGSTLTTMGTAAANTNGSFASMLFTAPIAFDVKQQAGDSNRVDMSISGNTGNSQWMFSANPSAGDSARIRLENSLTGTTGTGVDLHMFRSAGATGWRAGLDYLAAGGADGGTGDNFYIRRDGSAAALFINSSGNVGVSNVAPAVKLDVTGAITASGTITGNLFSGSGASLTSIPITGLSSFTSAQLRTALSDENGTGAALFSGATSPDFAGTATMVNATTSGVVTLGTSGFAVGAGGAKIGADSSGRFRFSTAGSTDFATLVPGASTTAITTLPATTGTLATLDGTETLTNKSISASQVNTGTVGNGTLPGSFTTGAFAGAITGTSNSASALAVGRLGATTPALQVDASTATSITGIKIKSAATGGGVALSAIGEATNGNLTIDAQGSGTIGLAGTSTGSVKIGTSTQNPTTGILLLSKSSSPQVIIENTGGSADQKMWDFLASTTQFSFRVINDANSAAASYITVTRSGYTVSTIALGAAATTVSGTLAVTGNQTNSANLVVAGKVSSTGTAPTALVTGNTTFAVTSNLATITGTNAVTIGTITGGADGMVVYLLFVDGNVTITDTDGTGTADSVNVAGTATNFTSAAQKTLTLIRNGTKWFEVARSTN